MLNIIFSRYVITLEEVLFSWTDFEFLVPVLHYYIGLKAGITDTEDIMDCSDMVKPLIGYCLAVTFVNIYIIYSLQAW